MAMNPRLLRPLATGFNPKSIAGLIGWWDFSDASTVTLDSGRVAGLADKSGNSRDATNTASGSTQPDYIIGGRNGRNVGRYVTADLSVLNISSTAVPASHTVFHVFWRPTAGTHSFGLTATTDRPYTMWWFTDNVLYQASNASFTTHGTASTSTGGFVVTTRRTGTASVLVRRNFAVLQNVTTGTGVTNAATGAWTRIGRSLNTSTTGDIGELLLYDSALSDSQVDAVEKFLALKWGLTYP